MTLPERPNLEWLRGAARALLNALRAGDEAALARLKAELPGVAAPTLAAAQTVIAREHGFPSWPAMKAEAEARRARRVKPPSKQQAFAQDAFERLLAGAATGDPKVLIDRVYERPYGRTIGMIVRDKFEARPDDLRRVIDTYLAGLSHPNPRVRFESAHALDFYGDASCRAPLIALIDDPVPRVRWMAMHALSCDACKEDLWGDDDDVRRRIAQRAATDPSVQVRRHAVVAVGVAGGAGAAETLSAIVATETDTVVLRNAHVALRRLAGASATH